MIKRITTMNADAGTVAADAVAVVDVDSSLVSDIANLADLY